MSEATDPCPEPLRSVLTRWKTGTASIVEVIEASRITQLELLSEYERKPLPSPPQELVDYRALSAEEKEQMTGAEYRKLTGRHATFLAQECAVKLRNARGRLTLQDLLQWATEKNHPRSILSQIRAALLTHDDAVVL